MCGSGSVFRIRIRIRIQKAPEYGSTTDPDPHTAPDTKNFILSSEKVATGSDINLFWIIFVFAD